MKCFVDNCTLMSDWFILRQYLAVYSNILYCIQTELPCFRYKRALSILQFTGELFSDTSI